MKATTLILVLLLIASFLYSQSHLTGKIISSDDAPLSFANILLINDQDSSFVKGGISDDAGNYSLPDIQAGNYKIMGSMIGYKEKYSARFTVTAKNKDFNLPILIMDEEIASLAEVEIKAKKPLFKQEIDRLVVNVAQTINFEGNTALEILEKSPWVSINRQNESFSLAGKNGVFVMINGKLSRMPMSTMFQMLAGMPANNIEKIELITTPPANFDAEGDAGFINIVLKKNDQEGLNGSITTSLGYGKQEKIRPSLNFNYRKNKFNLYGDYAFNYNNSKMLISTDRVIDYLGETVITEVDAHRDPRVILHTARIGLDIELSPKTVIGVLTSLFDRDWQQETFNEAQYDYSMRPDSSLQGERTDRNKSHQYLFNINVQHKPRDHQQFNLDLDYFNYYSNQPQTYSNRFLDEGLEIVRTEDIRIEKTTPLNIWVSKLDYAIDITGNLKLEAGAKATFSDFTNDVIVEFNTGNDWLVNAEFSEKAGFSENIQAAYSTLSYQIDSKTTLNAGLRYEYTDTELESETKENSIFREYDNFFPSVFLSRKLPKDHSIQLAYSRRITRPTFDQLAPFVLFLDPNSFITGNSFLLPALTDQLKLDYQFKTIILSAQYSLDKNAIARFQPRVDPETNIIIYSSENLDRRATYSFSLNLPIYVNKWWEMQNRILATWSRVETDYQDVSVRFSQNSMIFNSSQTFYLPKNFTLELSASYNTEALDGLSKRKPFGAVNIGLQKKFKNNGGSLSFNVSDVFKTMKWELKTKIPELNLNNTMDFDFEFQVATLTYTRNFGSNKIKGSRKRKTGSAEERSRVRN